MKKFISFFTLLFICNINLFATNDVKNNFMKDLNSCMKSMLNKNFMMEINYQLYNNLVEGKPLENLTYKVGKFNNNIFLQNHLVTTFSNEKYQANIYYKDKVVKVDNAANKRLLKLEQILISDSNIWENYSSINLIADTLNIRTYKIFFKSSSPVQSFQITLNMNKFEIEKNIIFYNPKYAAYISSNGFKRKKNNDTPIIVLDFTKVKGLSKGDESMFYCSNIKVEKKGKVKLVNNLSDFKIYNYLKK